MAVDPTTTKYMIKATITADGVIEKPDIIGAIFGQTEGLLGNEMDLRDLQKGARIGRIEVDVNTKGGKSTGTIHLPSALDKVESAILAAALETIDRIGPAKAHVKIDRIEDQRITKREQVVDRAKELLARLNEDPSQDSGKISDEVRNAVQVAEIQKFRNTKLWCGPNVEESDSVIFVEGRSDVLNLLKFGIKNAVGVEGTSVPQELQELSREKTTTIFIDGDRGGELIARELLETCDVDFVARAPNTREVEELPHKLAMKCLKNKLTADQFIAQHGLKVSRNDKGDNGAPQKAPEPQAEEKPKRGRGRGRGRGKGDDKKSDEKTEDAPQRGGRPKKDDEEKPSRGRGRGRGGKDEDKSEAPARAAPQRTQSKPTPKKEATGDPRANLRETLSGLSGSLKATLLNDSGDSVKDDLAVRDLADTLKSSKDDVHTVVFDGVITQRLLDIAADRKVQTVVGVKMGNVTKVPETVEILTRDDLS